MGWALSGGVRVRLRDRTAAARAQSREIRHHEDRALALGADLLHCAAGIPFPLALPGM
jgi:hypothetical protein